MLPNQTAPKTPTNGNKKDKDEASTNQTAYEGFYITRVQQFGGKTKQGVEKDADGLRFQEAPSFPRSDPRSSAYCVNNHTFNLSESVSRRSYRILGVSKRSFV